MNMLDEMTTCFCIESKLSNLLYGLSELSKDNWKEAREIISKNMDIFEKLEQAKNAYNTGSCTLKTLKDYKIHKLIAYYIANEKASEFIDEILKEREFFSKIAEDKLLIANREEILDHMRTIDKFSNNYNALFNAYHRELSSTT